MSFDCETHNAFCLHERSLPHEVRIVFLNAISFKPESNWLAQYPIFTIMKISHNQPVAYGCANKSIDL